MPIYRFSFPMDNAIKNMEAVEEAVKEIIAIQTKVNEINRKLDVRIPLEEGETAELAKITHRRNILSTEIYIFVNAHQRSFTASVSTRWKGSGGVSKTSSKPRRSFRTSVGVFGWRFAPPRVEIVQGFVEEEVVKNLNSLGFTQYTRGKKLNRKQLLRDRIKLISEGMPVPGIIFGKQREDYFVTPKMERDPSLPKGAKITERLVRV